MLICDRPLVNSSMLAPGMPTSVLVVRPSPCVVVDVVVVVQAAAHVEDGRGAEHARPGARAVLKLVLVPVPAKPPLAGPP